MENCMFCGREPYIRYNCQKGDYFRCPGCGQEGFEEDFDWWRKKLAKEEKQKLRKSVIKTVP